VSSGRSSTIRRSGTTLRRFGSIPKTLSLTTFKEAYDRAIQDYSEAIRLKPTYVDAYKWRAAAFEQNGDAERAKADHETAERLGK
jgi:tetratricopeptide (TPR) repeat protein